MFLCLPELTEDDCTPPWLWALDGAALRAAPLSLSQTFRICASLSRATRSAVARGQTQGSSLLRGEPREHRAAREASKNIPENRKCFHMAQKAQPYLILLHRQRVIQIGGMGGGKSGMTFWDPQARGAVPVQARKVGQPSTHTDPHGPAPGPGRNQARSSEEGECQRGVLLEHFHFQLGWEMGNARGPCMQTFRGTLTDMVPQPSRLILGKEGSIHTRIVRNRRNDPSHAAKHLPGRLGKPPMS
jgi:hypothetical protein